jgi:hypothetical protein
MNRKKRVMSRVTDDVYSFIDDFASHKGITKSTLIFLLLQCIKNNPEKLEEILNEES